jgi:DNA-binding GntR family transcriptional regulator
MQPTPLITQLATRIVEHMQAEGLGRGERLAERKLAELFRVSRSPIRSALRLLEEAGIVQSGERGGYVIANAGGALADTLNTSAPQDDDEAAYRQIADDRLNGSLPERITENELLRRYGLTRGRLGRILRRIAGEGWIERLPGHGWAFLPVLTSLQAYEDSYRFRLLIEPAAILEPRFTLNRPVLEKCREQQQWLVEGGIWEVSDARLFELNSGMHEAIIECCQNSFFIDALKRINRVRRLVEYRQTLDRESAIGRCREHVHLLDLLLANKRREAAEFMRLHLAELSAVKPVARKRDATLAKQTAAV